MGADVLASIALGHVWCVAQQSMREATRMRSESKRVFRCTQQFRVGASCSGFGGQAWMGERRLERFALTLPCDSPKLPRLRLPVEANPLSTLHLPKPQRGGGGGGGGFWTALQPSCQAPKPKHIYIALQTTSGIRLTAKRLAGTGSRSHRFILNSSEWC